MPRGRPKGSKTKRGHKKLGRPPKSKNKEKKYCNYFINNKKCNNLIDNNQKYCKNHLNLINQIDIDILNENNIIDNNNFNRFIKKKNKVILPLPEEDDEYEEWEIEADYNFYNINNQLWKFYPKYEKWIKTKNNFQETEFLCNEFDEIKKKETIKIQLSEQEINYINIIQNQRCLIKKLMKQLNN